MIGKLIYEMKHDSASSRSRTHNMTMQKALGPNNGWTDGHQLGIQHILIRGGIKVVLEYEYWGL